MTNPSGGNRVIPCGGTDGQTDMTKLIVDFAVLLTRLKLATLMCIEPTFSRS